MASIVRHELSADDFVVVLNHLQNDVADLLDMYGNTEEFVNEVKAMIARHANVPGFKIWATGCLRELREEKEAKEREDKNQTEEMIYLKAQNELYKEQMHDVFSVHGNVDKNDPLLTWLTQPWVYRLEKSLNLCHSHPDTARVFRELINSHSLTRPDVLNEEFLQACIPHLKNYNYPVTAHSLKEGVRKILYQS